MFSDEVLKHNAINLYSQNYTAFIRHFWDIVEPSNPYIHNWHIDAIADHLTACANFEISKLVINIPPRFAKSLLCCVFFPAWVWTTKPEIKFLFASYALSLAKRDSRNCRTVIQSKKYQELFSDVFQLSDEQNEKVRFANDKTGLRLSTSTGSALTGEGGDLRIIDDPHNAKEVESKTKRQEVIDWYDLAFSSRINNPQKNAMILIMQRLHANDLTAHILEKEKNVVHLCLPQEYEKREMIFNPLGFTDPRKNEGELLFPERFNQEFVNKEKIHAYRYAGQQQQRPAPREGGLIKLKWFNRYNEKIEFDSIVFSLDTASKASELNDYSVCSIWGKKQGQHYLIHIWREKVLYPELKSETIKLINQYKPNEILIEDKGSGIQLIQELQLAGYPVIAINPGKLDKVTRMSNQTGLIESGNVYIPEYANWLPEFEMEIMNFPNVEHDDIVDTISQYLTRQQNGTQYFL